MKPLKVFLILGILWIQIYGQTVTDIEGNVYETITIGTQVWTKENLKATRYNDNTPIPNIKDSSAWSTLTTPAYCEWGNTSGNRAIYGALYNWYVVDDSKEICPSGWHVPSDSEWSILSAYLGGDSVAGSHLKETGNEHWLFQNREADNNSGFTALPSGHRHRIGSFATLGYYGFFWSSTKTDSLQAFNRFVSYNNSVLGRSSSEYTNGFCIRCIRDLPSQIGKNFHSKQCVPEIPISIIKHNVILVDSGNKERVVTIYKCSGQIIQRGKLKPGRNELDVGFLTSGSYILSVSHSSSTFQTVFVLY